MAALSTLFRQPTQSPQELCDTLRAFDTDGLALDRSMPRDFVDELLRNALPAPIVAIESRSGAVREPMLASDDPEERRAAAKQVRDSLEQAAHLGARILVLSLGRLRGKHGWADTRLQYARREFSTEDAHTLLEERRAQAVLAVDLGRFAIDAVVDMATHTNVVIGLCNRARWFEIPDEPELATLLADFAGAPLAPWFDTAAAHASESLGLTEPGSWLARFGEQASGAWMSDACGMLGGLPWGFGEIETDAVASALGADGLRVVHCAPAATTNEIRAALARALARV